MSGQGGSNSKVVSLPLSSFLFLFRQARAGRKKKDKEERFRAVTSLPVTPYGMGIGRFAWDGKIEAKGGPETPLPASGNAGISGTECGPC
jgi:hypothetical protein